MSCLRASPPLKPADFCLGPRRYEQLSSLVARHISGLCLSGFPSILLMVSRHANDCARTSGQRECPLTSKLYFTTAHNAHSHSRLSDTNGSGETIRISVAALTSTCVAALLAKFNWKSLEICCGKQAIIFRSVYEVGVMVRVTPWLLALL